MATILIGYDLNAQKNYAELIEAIKQLGPWWHHLDSMWLVKTSLKPTEVRDLLRQHLDRDDELLVIDVSSRSRAWNGGFSERAQKWLKETYD